MYYYCREVKMTFLQNILRILFRLLVIGCRPSSSVSTGCVVPLRGASQEKIPWNNLPWLGIKLGPRREQTVRFIHSPTELS